MGNTNQRIKDKRKNDGVDKIRNNQMGLPDWLLRETIKYSVDDRIDCNNDITISNNKKRERKNKERKDHYRLMLVCSYWLINIIPLSVERYSCIINFKKNKKIDFGLERLYKSINQFNKLYYDREIHNNNNEIEISGLKTLKILLPHFTRDERIVIPLKPNKNIEALEYILDSIQRVESFKNSLTSLTLYQIEWLLTHTTIAFSNAQHPLLKITNLTNLKRLSLYFESWSKDMDLIVVDICNLSKSLDHLTINIDEGTTPLFKDCKSKLDRITSYKFVGDAVITYTGLHAIPNLTRLHINNNAMNSTKINLNQCIKPTLITHLILDQCFNSTPDTYQTISSLSNLTHLSINGPSVVLGDTSSTPQLLKDIVSLQHLKYLSLTNLEYLIDWNLVGPVLEQLRNLERFKFSIKDSTCTPLTDHIQLTNIKYLSINLSSITGQDYKQVLESLSNMFNNNDRLMTISISTRLQQPIDSFLKNIKSISSLNRLIKHNHCIKQYYKKYNHLNIKEKRKVHRSLPLEPIHVYKDQLYQSEMRTIMNSVQALILPNNIL